MTGNFTRISKLLKPEDNERLSVFRKIFLSLVLYLKSKLNVVANDSGAWFSCWQFWHFVIRRRAELTGS